MGSSASCRQLLHTLGSNTSSVCVGSTPTPLDPMQVEAYDIEWRDAVDTMTMSATLLLVYVGLYIVGLFVTLVLPWIMLSLASSNARCRCRRFVCVLRVLDDDRCFGNLDHRIHIPDSIHLEAQRHGARVRWRQALRTTCGVQVVVLAFVWGTDTLLY